MIIKIIDKYPLGSTTMVKAVVNGKRVYATLKNLKDKSFESSIKDLRKKSDELFLRYNV